MKKRKPRILKEEELREIKDYIHIGKAFSEKEYKTPNKDFKNYYKVEHYKNKSDKDQVAVPQTFSIVRTILPNVLNDRPHILCSPNNKDTVRTAKINQALANSMWKDYKVQPEVELAAIDLLVTGRGLVKLGWQYESKKVISAEPREIFGMKFGEKEVEEEITIKDEPFVEWVDPATIYVSPDAKNLDDSPFVIQELVQPLNKVKNNPMYRNTKDLKATRKMSKKYTPKEYTDDDKKTYLDKVVLYEIYLRDTREIITLVEGHDKELSIKKFPYRFDTFHPFEDVENYRIPGFFYAFGEAKPILHQQKEIDKIRTRQIQYGKRFARVILHTKSAQLTDNALKDLMAGKDGTLVEVGDIEGVKVLEYPDISRDTATQESAVKKDIQETTGVSEYQRASVPSGSDRTATETNAIQSGSEARPNEKLRKMEEFMARIARKLIALAQQYYDAERIIRITDEEGVENEEGGIEEFVNYTGKDLIGDFNIDIEVGSTQARNPEMEKKQVMELWERFADDKNVNRRELIKTVFKAYKFDKNENLMVKEDEVPDDPPPEMKPVLTFDSNDFTKEQLAAVMKYLGVELPPADKETIEQEGKIIGEQAKAQSAQQQSEQELAIEQERAELEMKKILQEMAIEREKAQLEVEKTERELEAAEDKAELELVLTEKKFDLEMKITQEKAQQEKVLKFQKAQQEQIIKAAKAATEASKPEPTESKDKTSE